VKNFKLLLVIPLVYIVTSTIYCSTVSASNIVEIPASSTLSITQIILIIVGCILFMVGTLSGGMAKLKSDDKRQEKKKKADQEKVDVVVRRAQGKIRYEESQVEYKKWREGATGVQSESDDTEE